MNSSLPASSSALRARAGSALLLVAHGSTSGPESSDPAWKLAREIRRRGIFAGVHCAFWKEEPGLCSVAYAIEAREIFVVPLFISEGYFTREIIPRELGLTGRTTEREGRIWRYCDPVGIHPDMTPLLLQRARQIAPEADPARSALLIAGHGTSLNANSREAVRAQVRLLKEAGAPYREIADVYLEEHPRVEEWDRVCSSPVVIVLPFLIADGPHTERDIPLQLGLPVEEERPAAGQGKRPSPSRGPAVLKGRTLYYSHAIGADPAMAEIVLDQVEHCEGSAVMEFASQREHAASLSRHLDAGPLRIGQAVLWGGEGKGYGLCHEADWGLADELLERLNEPEDVREWARFAADGSYRVLKGARDLRRGWRLIVSTLDDLVLALDALYPALLGQWLAGEQGRLRVVPFRQTLERQTGRFRSARRITEEGVARIVQARCHSLCLREVLWPEGRERDGASRAGGEGMGLVWGCCEACHLLLEDARREALQEGEKDWK